MKVFPNIETLMHLNHEAEVLRMFSNKSVPQLKRVISKYYLDKIIPKVQKKKQDEITLESFHKLYDDSVSEYEKEIKVSLMPKLKRELQLAETELNKLENQFEALDIQADKFAKKLVIFGFMMCLGQTAGYGMLIFKIFSWDVMEPITYLTSAFYACVGMGFYLKYREDFEIGSVWDAMKARKLA